MLESLRARLLLWYALILALVVSLFAGAVGYVYRQSLVRGIDRDLQGQAAAISSSLHRDVSGYFELALPPPYRESEFGDRQPRSYYAVWDSAGALIDRSGPGMTLPERPAPGIVDRGGHREATIRTVEGATILVGRDLSEVRRDVRDLAFTVSGVGAGVLLLSLLGGWFLTGRALAPIARISRAARAMADGDLAARIAVEQTENELEQVALALNQGFERLRLAAEVQRRFTADASHELRTPLATLQASLDWALKRPRGVHEYVGALETCRRAGRRMANTVDELISIAHQETPDAQRREPVAMGPLVEEAVALLQPLADERGVQLQMSLDPAFVVGDATRLSEVVINLVKNAIEYNRASGSVSVSVSSADGLVRLAVVDTGVGIAADDLPHVFDRFYRADKARTRRGGGAGLGLAIVKRVVDDHRGSVTCRSGVGRGTEVVVELPTPVQRLPEAASHYLPEVPAVAS